MLSRARAAAAGVFLLCLSIFACSSGNVNAPASIHGKVTYNGAPVTGGFVYLHYQDGSKLPFSINSDGSYGGDSPEGEVTVTVDTEAINPAKKQEYRGQTGGGGGSGPGGKYGGGKGMYGKGGPPRPAGVASGKGFKGEGVPDEHPGSTPVYMKIPAKYADTKTSGLSITLKKGKNEFNIPLAD
jgi:hypothetical protein